MATITLDNSPNPKAMVDVSNNLIYKDKNGAFQERTVKTAITEVVREAAQVNEMGQGKATLSVKTKDDKWNTYFVNKLSNGTITLNPNEQAKTNGADKVYFNKHFQKDANGEVLKGEYGEKIFYSLNDTTPAGKAFLENISVNSYETERGAGKSLNVRVPLSNPQLVEELKEKGSDGVAVLSKEGYYITTKQELFMSKEPKQEIAQNKEQAAPKKDDMER